MKGRNHQIPLTHRYPNIEYIFQDYSEREMGWLWEKTNCFVFPSRGEGFGLPPLEAMAHGIPTIITNGSALQSFAQLGIPLPVSRKIPAIYDGKGGVGFWDMPDEKELRSLMLQVYQNYEEEKKRAVTKAEEVWDIYNFEKIAPVLAETITKLFTDDQKHEN
jgi:glycosyltransferase involved in cell wall biosynthesis